MPHMHHDEMSTKDHVIEHDSAESLLDFIQLAFHFNPSENHLEDYQTSNIDFQVLVFCEEVTKPEFIRIIHSTIDFGFEDCDFHQPILASYSSISFRGPPELT